MSNSSTDESISFLVSTLNKTAITRRLQTNSQKIEPRTLILIISPLDGYGLDEFQKSVSSSNTIVAIGVSPHHCKEYRSHTEKKIYTSKVRLLYGEDLGAILLNIIHTQYPQRCHMIYYSSEAYRYKNFASELLQKCQMEIKQCWANHATESYFGNKWLHNIWYNLSQTHHNPKILFGHPLLLDQKTHKESIAMVIGAGPSLHERVLECIATHREKITLFAADTALPTLHHYGIVPDFTTLLESQVHNMKDLIPSPDPHIVAIGDICCYPPSLRSFSHTLYVATQFASLSFFTRYKNMLPPLIPPLGSVGIMATYMAIHAGFKYILLAGLDFSYFRGLSHSWSSPTYTHWLNTQHRTTPWHHADAHFSNPRLEMISSSNMTHASRVHDSTLHMFRVKFEQSILPLARKYKAFCYDLNQESIIQGIPHIPISKAHSLLQSLPSMSLPLYSGNTVNTHYKNLVNAERSLQILIQEKSLLQRLLLKIEYMETHTALPSHEDWAEGLDMLSFTLSEDPYRIHNDISLWKEHKLYMKLKYNAQKLLYDIDRCLSYTHAQ